MKRYFFAIVFSGGSSREVSALANNEKDARKIVWDVLSDAQKDSTESIDLIDIID